MIFCSKFIKTTTSSALLAGVASSSFVSGYDTKLRRGISCDEDKDISSDGSKLEALTKKDVTNVDDENLVKDDELDNYEDNRRVHKDNRSSYEDTDSVDKVPIVNKHETEISKLKDNKSSSESDLLKSLDFKTVVSIISASSSIGILSGLSKKLYFDKKVNPTKPDEPKPYIQDDDKSNDNPDPNEKEKKKDDPEPHIKDDDKNKDNPDSHKKEKKKDEPGPSPVTPASENSNKKYILITLGVFGFVVLAVIFFYRTRIKYYYRKYFGYKKYIENHPDDWWELYTQGYIEPKFIPKAEKMYVCYVYVTESPQVKKIDEFYKKMPERNNEPQFFQQWLKELNKTTEENKKILDYFTNNFYKDLKSDITVLTNYFFNDESKFKSEDFIIKDGELKFLSNENEYDLDKFGTFLLYDGDGDPYVYSSRATKSVYFTFLLLKDDNEMLASIIESMDRKLEISSGKMDCENYSSNAKNFFNDLFTSMNNFLKFKFEDFDDKDEKKNFVNRRIDSIEEIINKANNRIEKAWKVYQKHKEKIKSLEGDRKNSNEKIDFLTYYILLDNDQLKQKYNFLKDEDLKIEPEQNNNIIEINTNSNNN